MPTIQEELNVNKSKFTQIIIRRLIATGEWGFVPRYADLPIVPGATLYHQEKHDISLTVNNERWALLQRGTMDTSSIDTIAHNQLDCYPYDTTGLQQVERNIESALLEATEPTTEPEYRVVIQVVKMSTTEDETIEDVLEDYQLIDLSPDLALQYYDSLTNHCRTSGMVFGVDLGIDLEEDQ